MSVSAQFNSDAAGSGDRSAASTESRQAWVRIQDDSGFSANRISPIRHNLQEHPLLQLPRLAKLAHDLMPTKQCRFIQPESTQTSAFLHLPKTPNEQSIDDVFEHIEETGSWVALYDIQTDPEYRALLNELIDSVRRHFEAEHPGLFHVAGFIFISAPPSVTPFHIDRENNFWMQLRGRKVITVFDHKDREVVSAPAVEDFIVHGSLHDVRLKEELRSHGHDFDVGPGEGVYFPSTSPHMTKTHTDWVRPGDGVSISLGAVFYTSITRRHARAHQCNRIMRHLGMNPAFPGQSAWRDTLKAGIGWAVGKTRAKFRGYKLPLGH